MERTRSTIFGHTGALGKGAWSFFLSLLLTPVAFSQEPAQPGIDTVLPAVVSINIHKLLTPRGAFSSDQSGGSGFIVDLDEDSQRAWIVTNDHVMAPAQNYAVVFHNKQSVSSETGAITLVGRDPVADLALLEADLSRCSPSPCDAQDLAELPWGDSKVLNVGTSVWAVGDTNKEGVRATQGQISQLNKYLGDPFGRLDARVPGATYIDHSADMAPGNSGGPLVAFQGSRFKVVGVNVRGAGDVNLYYAIPSARASRIVGRMKQGQALRCDSGLTLMPVSREQDGVRITCVRPGSAADLAGLQDDDLILSINDEPFKISSRIDYPQYARFWELLDEIPEPGDTISLRVRRGTQELTLILTTQAEHPHVETLIDCSRYGLILRPLTQRERAFWPDLQGYVLLHLGERYGRTTAQLVLNPSERAEGGERAPAVLITGWSFVDDNSNTYELSLANERAVRDACLSQTPPGKPYLELKTTSNPETILFLDLKEAGQ